MNNWLRVSTLNPINNCRQVRMVLPQRRRAGGEGADADAARRCQRLNPRLRQRLGRIFDPGSVALAMVDTVHIHVFEENAHLLSRYFKPPRVLLL